MACPGELAGRRREKVEEGDVRWRLGKAGEGGIWVIRVDMEKEEWGGRGGEGGGGGEGG